VCHRRLRAVNSGIENCVSNAQFSASTRLLLPQRLRVEKRSRHVVLSNVDCSRKSNAAKRSVNVAVTGESRAFVLHRVLRDQFGVLVADTLMEHLPPAGWGDVAGQSDIGRLGRGIQRLREVDLSASRTSIINEVNVLLMEKFNSHLRWIIGLSSAQFIAPLAIALRWVFSILGRSPR
jgi:hypothetical protein